MKKKKIKRFKKQTPKSKLPKLGEVPLTGDETKMWDKLVSTVAHIPNATIKRLGLTLVAYGQQGGKDTIILVNLYRPIKRDEIEGMASHYMAEKRAVHRLGQMIPADKDSPFMATIIEG